MHELNSVKSLNMGKLAPLNKCLDQYTQIDIGNVEKIGDRHKLLLSGLILPLHHERDHSDHSNQPDGFRLLLMHQGRRLQAEEKGELLGTTKPVTRETKQLQDTKCHCHDAHPWTRTTPKRGAPIWATPIWAVPIWAASTWAISIWGTVTT